MELGVGRHEWDDVKEKSQGDHDAMQLLANAVLFTVNLPDADALVSRPRTEIPHLGACAYPVCV
jgi:hypothetical protein